MAKSNRESWETGEDSVAAMDEIPIQWILLMIASAVLLLLCLITCCAVRCFRPEGTRGPDWFVRKDGNEQLVKSVFRNDRDPKDDGRNWLRVKEGGPLSIQPASLAPLPTAP